MAWLLLVAMLAPVSNLNTVLSCCECSADAVVTVPTLSLRHRARSAGAPDGFSGSSWLALPLSRSNFHLVFIVFCASSSCDESEHCFS